MTNEARIHNGNKTASSINSVGKIWQWHAKSQPECFHTSYLDINSKWIQDLNARPEGIKLVEENISRTLTRLRNIFLHVSSVKRAAQVVLVVKNPPKSAGDIRDAGSSPRSGRSPGGEHGNPQQYSCLESPMDREAWPATVHSITRSWTEQNWLSTAHRALERKAKINKQGYIKLKRFYTAKETINKT